jgi:hypothetical protein
MFGFKRAKPEAFSDFLDQIDPPVQDAEVDEAQAPEISTVSPSPSLQSQDWLLQLLSGMVSDGGEKKNTPATPPVFEASYLEDVVYLEDAVAPLLEAIASCEQDAIAEELGLHADLSLNELKKLRRTFARDNHPDRLDPSRREVATRRMTIANMLIDREIRQKSSSR